MTGNAQRLSGTNTTPSSWGGVSLAQGQIGIALFLAEMAFHEPSYLMSARIHLQSGVNHGSALRVPSLHAGAAGIGFVASTIARSPKDYQSLIRVCDDLILTTVVESVRALRLTPDVLAFHDFDVMSGVSGIGRYLLMRYGPNHPAVRMITSFLIELTIPKVLDGHRVPGWCAKGTIKLGNGSVIGGDGPYLNLGLAHGIAGPLAYLAVAKDGGAIDAGLDEAIERVVSWLVGWLGRGAQGTNWPSWVFLDEEMSQVSSANFGDRRAWCYGTPGIASSIQLAGSAMGRQEWIDIAVEALACQLSQENMTDKYSDLKNVGLCHGWAGILRIAQKMAPLDPTGRLASSVEYLAQLLVDSFDPLTSFGFRNNELGSTFHPENPGLLSGCAGTALSLLAYANGGHSQTNWEEVFLNK
jgi:lantibiotic modifying enzyme